MLSLYNSLGRQMQTFNPVNPGLVTIFTCGPSVYLPAHIGNFRTFLFEDILVRYLEYCGYRVARGMNFTDIEDKAIAEAARRGKTVPDITAPNISRFVSELKRLRMKVPDYLPRASCTVQEAAEMIARLLEAGVAYQHGGNIYFDPLKSPGFGSIYGLDMSSWPRDKRRFHKDTYPGTRWNRGDFILWHGCQDPGAYCWETKIGRGRPSWNIQDAGMVASIFSETLSVYCGGIDNLVRHHDYNKAILESARPFPMARFWLHCDHLIVNGRKMSKSLGNIIYVADLLKKGYSAEEIRFFLICGRYREKINYSGKKMAAAAARLQGLRGVIRKIAKRATGSAARGGTSAELDKLFTMHMDRDLDLRGAIEALEVRLSRIDPVRLSRSAAAAILKSLRKIDGVVQVLFPRTR